MFVCKKTIEATEVTDRNPRYLIQQICKRNDVDKKNHFPDFYVACGLQDELLNANRSIAKALKEAGADVVYEESEGIHDWYFWGEYIRHVIKWLNLPSLEKK